MNKIMSHQNTHENWVPIGDNPDEVLRSPEKIPSIGPCVDRTLKSVFKPPIINRSLKHLTDELLDYRDEELALKLSQLKM